MVKVVLDTNVLLDYLAASRPEHQVAEDLMRHIIAVGTDMCVAATSLKDIYYVLSHTDGEPTARSAVEALITAMTVLPVDKACCRSALINGEPDFEDGLIRSAAETARAAYLITRDQRAFASSSAKPISPAAALREL